MAINYATIELRWDEEYLPPAGQRDGIEAAIRADLTRNMGEDLNVASDLMFHNVPLTKGEGKWDGPMVFVYGPKEGEGEWFGLKYDEKPEWVSKKIENGPLTGKDALLPGCFLDDEEE